MFERYTEKARRVIFFARYEASNFGCPYIETEHLLLGLLREDKALANNFLKSHAAVESIRKQIEEHTTVNEKIPTSVDLPLSQESRRALALGAEESERHGHQYIGTLHLLAGLLRVEKGLAAEILLERGLGLDKVRQELARGPAVESTPVASAPVAALRKAMGALAHQLFNLPHGVQAEVTRQAQARGIDVQTHLVSLIERGLQSPPVQSDAEGPKDIFERLRREMVAEGAPQLDAAALEEEIARRKGIRQ